VIQQVVELPVADERLVEVVPPVDAVSSPTVTCDRASMACTWDGSF
jgi:hypothetical protein